MRGAGCDTTTPIATTNGLPEVRGVAQDASVYGLLFLTHEPPIRKGDEVKIVWRMTGQGDLAVESISPTGRPGVLTFGCWRIHLERTVGMGDVWIDVAATG